MLMCSSTGRSRRFFVDISRKASRLFARINDDLVLFILIECIFSFYVVSGIDIDFDSVPPISSVFINLSGLRLKKSLSALLF